MLDCLPPISEVFALVAQQEWQLMIRTCALANAGIAKQFGIPSFGWGQGWQSIREGYVIGGRIPHCTKNLLSL